MTRHLVSQTEFARIIEVDKAHVTRLKQAGRLVMVEEGGKQLVDVEASRVRIEETADPAHAAGADQAPLAQGTGAKFNAARAREMEAKADLAEMEAREKAGKLVDAEEARLFAANLGATFGAQLDALVDRLAPELVAIKDVDGMRAVLAENFDATRREVARLIEKGITG